MYTNNPYAHAGWPNANPNAVNMGSSGGAPSVFGALPFTGPSSQAAILTFTFVSFNPNIMNCIVMGPDGKPYFRISTDNPRGGYTGIQRPGGDAAALVEWKENPLVEVRGIIPRQPISQWLALSPQRDRRIMVVSGTQYIWVPSENDISLYTSGHTPSLVAKVIKQGGVRLEITANGIHVGLLEPCVTAAMLLLSGQTIG